MSYNTQKIFPASRVGGDDLLVVKTNGGSVTVECEIDGEWITVYTFSEDGAYSFTRRSDWRVTPAGGAVYDVR